MRVRGKRSGVRGEENTYNRKPLTGYLLPITHAPNPSPLTPYLIMYRKDEK